MQDSRAYIVGLSDDAGAAQNAALGMKVSWAPTQSELLTLDSFQANTLYGTKATQLGPVKSLQIRPEDEGQVDGIRMTMCVGVWVWWEEGRTVHAAPPPPPPRRYYYCATPGTCTPSNGSGYFPYTYTVRGLAFRRGGRALSAPRVSPCDSLFRPVRLAQEQDKCSMPVGGPIWCM